MNTMAVPSFRHEAGANLRAENFEMRSSKLQKADICAVVITYHPDATLFERMTHVRSQVGRLIVVDNHSEISEIDQLHKLSSELGAHLILNPHNRGVGAALNQGLAWAAQQSCTWALTLDQDSSVSDDMIATLSAVYEDYPKKERLAILGSNYIDRNSRQAFSHPSKGDGSSWQAVPETITSGSLISVPAYAVIGPFREDFFMDFVDTEYCLRARARRYKIVLTRKTIMRHAIGACTLHNLPWKATGTTNHSAVRRYYMTRNHLVLVRQYIRKEPLWALSTLYSRFKSTILMCLFERDKARKLMFTATGVLDGLLSNFSRDLSESPDRVLF